ncbi:tyrosine-type recombinase/integrase [Alkaliphilus sp. B6464]|uniref:tyrosine-type recombinase/integrase n=1 Tax=Alkaliphilus sp. B6464 TaxID=2731219 RepID=UPI001BAC1AB5|nr:tyrosine-type recombinase/integrase [Alkaliphilus sp. B6464]QUH20243.1 tyrosine-type recombinase/integrase [Alkaliphilus sp. B6464]
MSVRKVGDGYKAEVFLGINSSTGKKIRKTKTFKKQKDAKDWERDILQAYKTGNLSLNGDIKLSEYLEYWYDTYVIANTKYNTQKRYRTLINCVKEHLGHITLDKLRTPIIDRFYADLKLEMIILKDGTTKRRYMDGTILKVHKLFRQAMGKAVGWDMIDKNPVDYATSPDDDKRNKNTWSLNIINDFLDYIKDEKIYLPSFIAFNTGLREGEIAALRFKYDIDFKAELIKINHNMVEKTKEGPVLEEPKTESSKDTVAMTKDLLDKLKQIDKEYKKYKLKTGIELEFVCSWEDGRPLRPTYISQRFSELAKRFAIKREIEPITFHGLRHSHATILFELGASSQEISKRLRHSRVSTTDDIYIHVKEDIKKSTADLFNQAVEKIK